MNDARIAALRAMAQADESPRERDIARTKLAEAGVPIEPPRPPAPPAATPSPAPMPRYGFGFVMTTTSTAGGATSSTGTFMHIRVVTSNP